MRVFALIALLSVAAFANEYFCSYMTPLEDGSAPMLTMGGNQFDWNNFNGLSFQDFYGPADGGDIEGRLAAKNNVVGTSWSVGAALLVTGPAPADAPMPYDLIVGNNFILNNGGSVNNGADIPGQGYVAGTATVPSYILPQLTTGLSNLADQFTSAQAYFNNVSQALALSTVNTAINVQYGGLTITCNSATDSSYVVDITAAQFSTVTYYIIDSGCNSAAQIVFNIGGTGNVLFSGNNQNTFSNDKVIYNILTTGTVNVVTEVDGCILAPSNLLHQTGGVIKGLVVAGNIDSTQQINRVTCVKPQPASNPNPCVGFEDSCTGLTATFSNGNVMSFTQYNVISFGDFNANTSDVEGRVAAAGNVNLGAGYSIGAALSTNLNTPDVAQDYALIAGGNVNWISGALFPTDELILTNVGTDNVPAEMIPRLRQTSDNLAAIFANAYTCYEGYSQKMASNADNVAHSVSYSALNVVCQDANANEYYMSLTSSDLAQSTYATTSNCNWYARWIINIRGNDDITFTGASFPSIPGATVYNVIGSRNVYVHDISLNGHLLAPDATLYQTSGVIVGKVVVGDCKASWQINSMSTCPEALTVNVNLQAAQDSPAGARSIKAVGAFNVRPGDVSSAGTIVDVDAAGNVEFSNALPAYSQGDFVASVKVSTLATRPALAANPSNSASTVGVTFALLAIVALLF